MGKWTLNLDAFRIFPQTRQQLVSQLQGLSQFWSRTRENQYFQLYWEILQHLTHTPSFKALRSKGKESRAHLEWHQFSLVKTWWKCWELYQFSSSENCTQMRHYVPRPTSAIQTGECVKWDGGSWKYPDLWKTQNRKPALPLEMMREIVKTWILTHMGICAHVRSCTHTILHSEETTNAMRTVGFEESLVVEGSQMPADNADKKVDYVGRPDWVNPHEAWLETVPQEVWDILVLWTQGIRIFLNKL